MDRNYTICSVGMAIALSLAVPWHVGAVTVDRRGSRPYICYLSLLRLEFTWYMPSKQNQVSMHIMNPTIETSTVEKSNPIVKLPELGEFGNGRYSALMEESFRDAQSVFKLTEKQADKLARMIASDYGSAISNSPVDVKRIKAANKDGKITLAEAAKVKGVTLTNALFALMALQYAGEAGKHGFSFGNTGWKVSKPLADYFEQL